jgi:hypothetical protein
MPLRRKLGEKDIMTDLRRIRTGLGLATSGSSPHTLLGATHTDAATAAPVEGALVLADSTSEWNILLHPGAAGYALVTDATTWAIDQTPLWTGLHTFGVGKLGESLSFHTSMGEGHGLGGQVVVAPCASLRSAIVV